MISSVISKLCRRLKFALPARLRRQSDDIGHESVEAPFKGFDENRVESGLVEVLSDDDLKHLNRILPWSCFTVDSSGRRFGNMAWEGKRERPQKIPDPRIIEMNRLFSLKGKSVLEVGCFEGVHTIGLIRQGARVHAVDSRIENIVKTIIRCRLFGHTAHIFPCDLESLEDTARLPQVQFVHHVGVLYHLKDPVFHLLALRQIVSDGVLLDTHYATEDSVTDKYTVGGQEYKYFKYYEKGRNQVFAGMYDHAKWLLLDDIKSLLTNAGFSDMRIYNDVIERHGPRVTLYAARPGIIKE